MKYLTRTVITTALVVFGLQMQGCAFGDRNVELDYSATTGLTSNSSQKVAVMSFEDARSNQETVGEVRNNVLIKTADVIATNDVSTWMTEALMTELEHTGVNVRGSDAEMDSNVAITINGAVQESYIKQLGWLLMTTVRAQVSITKDGITYSDTEYIGKSSSPVVAGGVGEYRSQLRRALQDMMETMVPDVLDAMD
jgi:hypothetical protein